MKLIEVAKTRDDVVEIKYYLAIPDTEEPTNALLIAEEKAGDMAFLRILGEIHIPSIEGEGLSFEPTSPLSQDDLEIASIACEKLEKMIKKKAKIE